MKIKMIRVLLAALFVLPLAACDQSKATALKTITVPLAIIFHIFIRKMKDETKTCFKEQ